MAKAKVKSKPVYVNACCIGAAQNWGEVSSLIHTFAADLFGRLYMDGRSAIALRGACGDHLAKAFGVSDLVLYDERCTETERGFYVTFGDYPD